MPRIKIEIPATKLASFCIPVRITDINYGNHVGNDSFISIIHEARMLWLKEHGFTELQLAGVGLIMSDLAVEFKNESYYGDTIEVAVFCGEIARVSFELFYQLSVRRNDAEIVLAHAKTGMVCYDYNAKKVALVPEALTRILQA